MRIGILIPTYNRKLYLSQSLGSVLNQTYRDLEIIVIDNGSTDGTVEFMATMCDPRLRYVVNEQNIGMIGSINKGINLFSQEVKWCTILSDDDFLDKEFIANLLHAANTFAAKSIVHSHRIFVDKHGNTIRGAPFSPREETALDYMTLRACSIRKTYLTGVLFNRKAFMEINGYPAFKTGIASDDAFIFALALKDRLVFDRQAHAFVRIHELAESISSANAMNKLQTIKQFEEYCRKAVYNAGGFDSKHLAQFEAAMTKYVKILNSSLWIQAAHSFSEPRDREHNQVAELLSVADNDMENYTFRVKFAVLVHKVTGIFLEQNMVYRACWYTYIKFYLFMMKIVSVITRRQSVNQ